MNSSKAIDSLSTLTIRWHSCGTVQIVSAMCPRPVRLYLIVVIFRTEELNVLVGELPELRAQYVVYANVISIATMRKRRLVSIQLTNARTGRYRSAKRGRGRWRQTRARGDRALMGGIHT